jgi:hypothetical protein
MCSASGSSFGGGRGDDIAVALETRTRRGAIRRVMASRQTLAIIAAGVAFVAVQKLRACPRGGNAAPPIDISGEPEQEELPTELPVTVTRGDRTFTIHRTHRYAIAGRVLSASTYDFAWTNDFFDVDLGLIWGDHVEDMLGRYTFYQDARWLYWRSDRPVSDQVRDRVGGPVPAERDGVGLTLLRVASKRYFPA